MSRFYPASQKGVEADLAKRLSKLRDKLIEKDLDGFLVSSQVNRYYLTDWLGDSESGYLFITPKQAFIITDSRYTEEVSQKVAHFELVEIDPYKPFWPDFFKRLKIKKIGFESQDLSVFRLKNLKKQTKGVRWLPTVNLIERLREFKDKSEIKLIKKAIEIAEKSFAYIRGVIEPGMRETEIALMLEHFMKENGALKNAWENLIVASGPNSSMAHYPAGERKVKKGDQILLDWGCVYQGYHCDISRVVFLGTPSKKQREVYNLVWQAQQLTFEKIKTGVKIKELDLAARSFLQDKTPHYFRHAVGHGVGLEVHELPRVNEKATEGVLPGQVFTLEPGIYIPNWGGVRLEDMVLINEDGYEILTKAPNEIEEVTIES